MKTLKTIFMILPMMAACTELSLYKEAGTQPDRSEIDASVISLRAEQSPDNTITISFTEGSGTVSASMNIFVHSSTPADGKCTVELNSADEEFVKRYSERTGVEYQLLPAAFYTFSNGKYMDLEDGNTESAANLLTVYARNMLGNVLKTGRYLLPIVGTSSERDMKKNIVYVDITVRERYKDPDGFELYTGKDRFTIFYLNTSEFDPRLANDMILNKYNPETHENTQVGWGNIINLRTASIGYDEVTGKVSVRPNNDLRYVLDHYTERVLPVQESGRKVCICIEGGGKGIGFCNLTDGQIREFAASVGKMVNTYGLDGINLWDRNSSYDKAEENGFPKMNTTSYAKLIKTLREVLGNDKLITVTDYEEPTASFCDAAACGDIEVGKLIDYAWHGYYYNKEPVQVVDPWNQDMDCVSSAYPRSPIAGLDRDSYGCIHGSVRKNNEQDFEDVQKWFELGYDNGILVFYDIRSIIQDQYEGGIYNPMSFFAIAYKNYYYDVYILRLRNEYGTGTSMQYGKWQKDW